MRSRPRSSRSPLRTVRLLVAVMAFLVGVILPSAIVQPARADEGEQSLTQDELNQLKGTDARLADVITSGQARMAALDVEIADARFQLAQTHQELLDSQQVLRARAVAAYKYGMAGTTLALFLDGQAQDMSRAEVYLGAVQSEAKRALDTYRTVRKDEQGRTERLASAKAEQDRVVADLVIEKQKADILLARGQAPRSPPNPGSPQLTGRSPDPVNLVYPPNLGPPVTADGYYVMPDPAPPGMYVWNDGTPPQSRCGSRTLTGVLYTVAQRWYAAHPLNPLMIGDLNESVGHVSHRWGADVDVYTVGKIAADTTGSSLASIELAEMFVDTGAILVIGYDDPAVISAIAAYTAQTGKPGKVEAWPNHAGHMHIRIQRGYQLPLMDHCP